jgi:non-canonical (house-cleaning) NTP pyrophosphatase
MEHDNENNNAPNHPVDDVHRVLRIAVGTTNPCKIKAVEHAMRHILTFHNKNTSNASTAVTIQVQGYNVPSNVADQPYNDSETKRGAMNRAKNAYYYYNTYGRDNNQYDRDTTAPEGAATIYECADQQEHIGEKLLPHLGIGIEGGLEWVNDDYSNDEVPISNDNGSIQQSTITNGTSSDSSSSSTCRQLYCMAWIAIYGQHNTPFMNELFGVADESSSEVSLPSITDTTTIASTKQVFGLSKTSMFALPSSLSSLITEQGMELGQADDILFRRTNSKQASGTVGLLTNSMIDRTSYYNHAIQLAIIPWLHPNLYPTGHHQNYNKF